MRIHHPTQRNVVLENIGKRSTALRVRLVVTLFALVLVVAKLRTTTHTKFKKISRTSFVANEYVVGYVALGYGPLRNGGGRDWAFDWRVLRI